MFFILHINAYHNGHIYIYIYIYAWGRWLWLYPTILTIILFPSIYSYFRLHSTMTMLLQSQWFMRKCHNTLCCSLIIEIRASPFSYRYFLSIVLSYHCSEIIDWFLNRNMSQNKKTNKQKPTYICGLNVNQIFLFDVIDMTHCCTTYMFELKILSWWINTHVFP